MPFSRELWIEREDFQETPPKGYFRLFPGNKVRLRYGYVVKCIGYEKDTDSVRCTYFPDTRLGHARRRQSQSEGQHPLGEREARHAAEVRLYDRLFKTAHPEGIEDLNPDSKKIIAAQLEPRCGTPREERFQFERHGYFVHNQNGFGRTVTLRDSWKA